MNNNHRFPFRWRIADGYPAKGIERHGHTVFGTFVCGGGSTMGYKLAGFNHLGGVELDPTIADVYQRNHDPRFLYNIDIRDFNRLDDLPPELYNLDLLDGSPPCSTFSMQGKREKAWGQAKQFAEGQKLQRLDDLVFVYCDTILKLRPKCFLLENVSGLIKGNGKVYCKKIVQYMKLHGYTSQVFLLNAASMGVPQMRERVFIIGHKTEIKLPPLTLNFNEPAIPFSQCISKGPHRPLSGISLERWNHRRPADRSMGNIAKRLSGKGSNFSTRIIVSDEVCPTLTTGVNALYDQPVYMNADEVRDVSTFPQDYDFTGKSADFLCGMSVPPVMTAQIAYQIYLQWLKHIPLISYPLQTDEQQTKRF